MYTIYQVKNGDTLSNVANNFGISIETLANINGITLESVLIPESYIVVPKEENLYFMEYEVKNGETIYGLARANNINPNMLLRLNGLNETDIIYPNQKIMLPRQNVSFYVTTTDDTLNNVLKQLNISANDLVNQNKTIYLTNDQLIVYKR